jgi:hypothetical protein
MPHFWKDWLALRRIWWVQLLYVCFLIGSYAIFAYVLSCIWLVTTPSLLEILLIAIGGFLGMIGICVSVIDCILLCFRRSIEVVPTTVVEPVRISVPVSIETPIANPLEESQPRPKPLGRIPSRLLESDLAV